MSFSTSDPSSALEEPQSASALNRSGFTSSAAQNLKRSAQAAFDGKSIPSLFFTSQSLSLFYVLVVFSQNVLIVVVGFKRHEQTTPPFILVGHFS
jgi:hypothetical protein